MFDVTIEVFEGPFDLLLQLIMRQELDIHEVPVSQITASFLEHLKDTPDLDLDTATEFLLIAATLLLIKTRSLLPAPEDEEEEGEPEKAREFLIERLIEYKKFQAVSERMAELYADHGSFSPGLKELESEYAHLYPDPFEDTEVDQLGTALIDLLASGVGTRVDTSYIAPVRVSVAEHLERVRRVLRIEGETTFTCLVEGCQSKLEVIATFLAILELYKRGEAVLSQRKLFGEIAIKRREGEKSGVA